MPTERLGLYTGRGSIYQCNYRGCLTSEYLLPFYRQKFHEYIYNDYIAFHLVGKKICIRLYQEGNEVERL